MAHLMLIDDDPGTLITFGYILRTAGHQLVTASSGREGLDLLKRQPIDLVLSDLRLPDISGLEILRHLRDEQRSTAFLLITGFGTTTDVVTAMRLGAVDYLEKPISEEILLHSVEVALGNSSAIEAPPPTAEDAPCDCKDYQAHAAARWARVVVPIIDSPRDLRTIQDWSRMVFTSVGTLSNWCRMAGISPRRALVFARLLRAVFLANGGRHKPENLLDVVDRRTLVGLLQLAGLNPQQDFPDDVETFLSMQTLVCDPDALLEVRRALAARAQQAARSGPFLNRR